jgi:hypothetical protein
VLQWPRPNGLHLVLRVRWCLLLLHLRMALLLLLLLLCGACMIGLLLQLLLLQWGGLLWLQVLWRGQLCLGPCALWLRLLLLVRPLLLLLLL